MCHIFFNKQKQHPLILPVSHYRHIGAPSAERGGFALWDISATCSFLQSSHSHYNEIHGLVWRGYGLIRKTIGQKVKTYCILCLSLGQAGQSSPLRNSEWQLSTGSHCYHILCIQNGNLSANNYKKKPLLEPILMGQLCFLNHPQICLRAWFVSWLSGWLAFFPHLIHTVVFLTKNASCRAMRGTEDMMRGRAVNALKSRPLTFGCTHPKRLQHIFLLLLKTCRVLNNW